MQKIIFLIFCLFSFTAIADHGEWGKRSEVAQSARRLSEQAQNLARAIRGLDGRRFSQLEQDVGELAQIASMYERQVNHRNNNYDFCNHAFESLRAKYLQVRAQFHRDLEVPHEDCHDEWYYATLDAFTRFALEYRNLRDLQIQEPPVIVVPPAPPVIIPRQPVQVMVSVVGDSAVFQGSSSGAQHADARALQACASAGNVECRIVGRALQPFSRQVYLSSAQGHKYFSAQGCYQEVLMALLNQCRQSGMYNCREIRR